MQRIVGQGCCRTWRQMMHANEANEVLTMEEHPTLEEHLHPHPGRSSSTLIASKGASIDVQLRLVALVILLHRAAAKSVAMAGALLARTSFIARTAQNNKSSAVSVTPRSRSVTARAQLANGSVTTSKPTNGGFEEGELERPAWTGDEPLSRFVSSLIAIKPLFNVMKIGARQVLIRTAEKNGISWTGMSDELLASDVYAEKELVEDKNVVYPDYYLKEFHAYSEGNLSWKAASEVAPATLSMMLRAIPTAQTPAEANKVLRDGWLQAIEDHHQMHSHGLGVSAVLDVGCSIGDSTRALADWFPSAHITGLDLSPYFLAVAQHMEKQKAAEGLGREKPISWLHANGECTGLPASSVDIISHAFVIHECPQHAIRGLLKEAYRLLRPGGTVALTDNSPKSKVIQNLPPAIFTLMKSTEPWMDAYYTFDLEGEMEKIGFVNVKSILTDPRHRTVTGTVPSSQD